MRLVRDEACGSETYPIRPRGCCLCQQLFIEAYGACWDWSGTFLISGGHGRVGYGEKLE
jgi:hypothetical protein